MVKLLLVFMMVTFNAFGAVSWKERVRPLLPSPIQEFEAGKTTLKDVEQKLGKANLVEGSKYYWERDGLKYALELTFKKDVLESLHYTFTGKKPDLAKLDGSIEISSFAPYPRDGGAAGRFLILKDKDSELIIDPISKTIHTVRLP